MISATVPKILFPSLVTSNERYGVISGKRRSPAMIIQNETSDRPGAWTLVAPITRAGRLPLSPLHVPLPPDSSTGLTVASVAALNHILSVDCTRLIKKLGVVDAPTLARVDTAISTAFGLASAPRDLDPEPLPAVTDAISDSTGEFKIGRYQR
jgi:mRNA-degrading endonuclease toxin of MazEF toxin-antitoxin module